jgi:hypothetical protein
MTRQLSLRLSLLVTAFTLGTLGSACSEPTLLGLLEPDSSCDYPTDSVARSQGTLDIGPTPALSGPYEAVLLVDGAGHPTLEGISVAFGDADGELLPPSTSDGKTFVFPSVEGEREIELRLNVDDNGLVAAPFTLVTLEEARALQGVLGERDEMQLRLELRVYFGNATNMLPHFVRLRVCSQCLVGVDAVVEDDELVCADGSAPTVVDDPPCLEGQDELYSSC